MLSNDPSKFEQFLYFKICLKIFSKFWKSKGDLPHTLRWRMFLTGTMVWKCTFCPINLSISSFLMKNVFSNHSGCQKHMSSQARQSCTCTLVWDKFPFNFQNFEKILRHILKYRNCSNLEGSLLSTIWSYGAKPPENFFRLIRLVYSTLHTL